MSQGSGFTTEMTKQEADLTPEMIQRYCECLCVTLGDGVLVRREGEIHSAATAWYSIAREVEMRGNVGDSPSPVKLREGGIVGLTEC